MLKIKEFERFAFSVWSPSTSDSVYLASVSAAYENPVSDGSVCPTPPLLELFCPDFSVPELEIRPQIGVEVDFKATCLCWTSSRAQSHLGLLIAGDAVGSLAMYDPEPLIDAIKSNVELFGPDRNHIVNDADLTRHVKCFAKESVHTGVVRSVDSNRFQANLFASAADEGEIFIWDIEKMDQPMIPSTRTQPSENISTISWNPRVQHILATASAGSCVIWDLRKSESVVHLTKAMCQFEPHLMAWSPDVATRLCLADPAHPTADIQLWDLRYPKHMLALLGRWPPPPSLDLRSNASSLGNAGSVNALAWSPAPHHMKSRPALTLHDPDLIAVSLTASGALPTSSGGCGSGLEPTSADFLVVWSVNEALNCVKAESAAGQPSNIRQPVFVGRLEGGGDEEGVSTTSDGLPNTSAVHWLPSNPGLVSVTQSDGWIGVYNLDAGVLGDATTPTRVLHRRSRLDTRSRSASNKVAEAFAELEIDLHSGTQKDEGDLLDISTSGSQQNDIISDVTARSAHLFHQLPQPMPRLRVAAKWTKRPCGASFGFGGRLAIFQAPNDLSRRPRSSASLCVARQASLSPGDTNVPGAETSSATNVPTTEGVSGARSVHLHWIDSLGMHPIRGLKSSLECLSEEKLHGLVRNLLQWLDQILTASPDRLSEICDKMAEVCVPHLLCCNSTWISPWELFKVQFQPTTERRKMLSSLLGFDEQQILKEIESTLEQTSSSMDSEFQCPCRMGSSREIAVENLSALRLALVTNNLEATIRLCMHGSFAALSCPGLSALSSISLLLAHQYQTPESYTALQSVIVDRLQHVLALSATDETHLRPVISILIGLLKRDWSVVISEWPLEDWSTAVALLANYVWASDLPLFRRLCGILINRLLDPLSESSLTPEVKGASAWAVSVISSDLNGLIRSWCWLCDVDNTENNGEALLLLTMQLVLLVRAMGCTQTVGRLVLDSTTFMPDVLTITQVLLLVAEWLGQMGPGHKESDTVSGLRLLRLAVDTATPEINETAHRLWCSLTDDQRAGASVKFEFPFYCPFIKTGTRAVHGRCPCAAGQQQQQQRQPVTNLPAHYGYPPQPTQYSAHPVAPAAAPAPLFAPSSGPFVRPPRPPLPPAPHHPAAPPILGPMKPNSYMPPELQPSMSTSTPPVPVGHNAPNFGYPPTITNPTQLANSPVVRPPTGFDQTWTPGTMIPSVVSPSGLISNLVPPMANSVMPSTDGRSLVGSHTGPQLSSAAPDPTQPNPVLPPVLSAASQTYPDGNASLPPPRTATSGAWNDPPFLANTYKPPTRPAISINQFYDPTQFASSGVIAYPSLPVGAVSPSLNMDTSGQAGSFRSWDDKSVNAGVSVPPLPPLPMTGFTPTDARLVRPVPNVSTFSASTPATAFQPPMPPFINRAQAPGVLRPPFGQSAHLMNGSQSQPHPLVPPLLPSQRPQPRLDASQWPAAQPLASPTRALNANSESAPADLDETLPGSNDAEPITNMHPVTAEHEAVEATLRKLVQLCRNCGGKPYANKMDTVDRRLQSLFTALRGGTGAHLMSDQVVHHLLDCVRSADCGDYGAAVDHANLLIQSATGFESIHGFAPGLKILMQSAKQLFPNQSTSPGDHLRPNQPSWPPTSMVTGMR